MARRATSTGEKILYFWRDDPLTRALARRLDGAARLPILACGPAGSSRAASIAAYVAETHCTGDYAPMRSRSDARPCACRKCARIRSGTPDIVTVDHRTPVSDLRSAVSELRTNGPVELRRRHLVVRHVHLMSAAAQDALLAVLEHPPPYLDTALTASTPDAVRPAVASRCHVVRGGWVPIAELSRLAAGVPSLALARRHLSGDRPPRSILELSTIARLDLPVRWRELFEANTVVGAETAATDLLSRMDADDFYPASEVRPFVVDWLCAAQVAYLTASPSAAASGEFRFTCWSCTAMRDSLHASARGAHPAVLVNWANQFTAWITALHAYRRVG